MGDLPYPVSPGSYRYGTGAVSPERKKKRVKLVYIKSGVKAPLLSDLEAKSTIHYGLDVVSGRPGDSNTPTRALEVEFEAPPPTANTVNGRRNTSNYTKDVVFMDQASEKVDFTKLHPYKWMSAHDRTNLPSIAPDHMYHNTFMNKIPANISRTPSPEFKAKRGLVLYEETITHRPQTVPGNRDLSQSEKPAKSSAKAPRQTKSVTFVRPSSNQVQLQQLKHIRSFPGANEVQKLELDVKSFDQRTKLAGPNGCLHAKVKHSIKFMKKVERGEILDLPKLPRPMHSEKGRYRPHSKTRVETPPLEVKVQDNADKNKDFKSAEVYLQLVKKSKSAASGRSNDRSCSSMTTPGMSEILAKYMNGVPYEDTPRTQAVKVDVPQQSNPPASRCSTRQSALKIPEWAQEEKSRHIEEVCIDVPRLSPS